MPVHAHLPRPHATRGIVADQPALVVACQVRAHLRLELRRETERWQKRAAGTGEAVVGGSRAVSAVCRRRGGGAAGGGETRVDEGVAAGETAEGQWGAVFEADVIGDLRLERLDVGIGGRVG